MILELLRLDDWHNVSETVEIAKGKNELPLTLRKGYKQFKRDLKWQKKNK
jgi:hypothetical protein